MNYPWVEVDCGQTGYHRELWCSHWRQFMRYFFNVDPTYDYYGSKVCWITHDRELHKTMTTIWTLKTEGYRTSYQSNVRTFFWVDENYYKEHRKEIIQWGERYGCKTASREHGWIEVPNERVELLFRMTWAGKCYE